MQTIEVADEADERRFAFLPTSVDLSAVAPIDQKTSVQHINEFIMRM